MFFFSFTGICQRHNDMYYSYINEARAEIKADIQSFFYHVIRDSFPDKNCEYAIIFSIFPLLLFLSSCICHFGQHGSVCKFIHFLIGCFRPRIIHFIIGNFSFGLSFPF